MHDERALREQARRAVHESAGPVAGPAELDGVQRKVRRTLEAQLAGVRRSHAPLACTRGCAMCCHLRVMATPADVFGLIRYMRTRLDRPALDALAGRIAEASARLHALPRERLLSTNLACPLLVDNACSMYPARPFNCRAYHSLDRDACLASFNHPEDPGLTHPQSALLTRINEGVQLGSIDLLDQAGADTRQ